MTFLEERNKLRQKSFNDEGYIDVVPLEDVLRSSLEMERIYAPIIKMTEAEVRLLLNYLEWSSLTSFIDFVLYSDGLYDSLTDEELAQAWLHPENIEIVG